jgi:hypothetical protein
MARMLYSEKVALVQKAREAMLSAVQIYNNPLISFKTESFVVLSRAGAGLFFCRVARHGESDGLSPSGASEIYNHATRH